MAESNHDPTSSGTDRRATARSSMRLSLDTQDEYDLEAMGISDGFRPMTTAQSGHNRISSHSSHREMRSTPPPRPSSLTKPRYVDNFALRHDGAMAPQSVRGVAAPSSSSANSITRSSSVSTNTPVIRAEGPYQGPTGPSFPYHMYPQNTRLARTASIATTSTAPVPSERPYAGPSEPTHPYGMYPQNIVPESESLHDPMPFSSIPVGFPGHGGNEYHRRLGPDGEEAGDIIGPLGHTEQLPPYTQYPDEAFSRKITPALPSLSGAGGIGLGTRNPEFDSREDLNSPLSRQSNHSITSDLDRQGNGVPLTQSEKPPEKKWKTIAQKKVWGIVPIWVFVLAGLIILIFCLIVGTAIGIIMHQHKSTSKVSPNNLPPMEASGTIYTATVTTTYDAVSLTSAPTGIPTLPTGTFLLPISTPLASSVTCLDSSSLYAAWSCQIPLSSIELAVSSIPNCSSKTHCNSVTLGQSGMPSAYFYGTQPPVLDTQETLYLVNDSLHVQYGPAWYFSAIYDKLVVVPEKSLQSATTPNKRGKNSDSAYQQKLTAQPGDKPWFCYWNGTTIDTFIYVNRSDPQAQPTAMSTTPPVDGSWPMTTPYALTPAAATSVAMSGAAASAAPTSGVHPGLLSIYPKLVRVGERRNTAEPRLHAPYCVQMQIQSDGSAVPFLDGVGTPVTIYLTETEPVMHRLLRRDLEEDDFSDPALELMERQTPQMPACNCVWQT